MATAWQGLGSALTLLAQDGGLLPRMEPFAGEVIARAYAEAGIDVQVGATVTGIRRPGGNQLHRTAPAGCLMREDAAVQPGVGHDRRDRVL
jgi:pyruvate/2-oxoglutarate dehydrogenase complex dihydrolipoamide dehydrogenase (E3) component